MLRLHGDLLELSEPPLQEADAQSLLLTLCSSEVLARLHAQKDVDLSFELTTNESHLSFPRQFVPQRPATRRLLASGAERDSLNFELGEFSVGRWPNAWRRCATAW